MQPGSLPTRGQSTFVWDCPAERPPNANRQTTAIRQERIGKPPKMDCDGRARSINGRRPRMSRRTSPPMGGEVTGAGMFSKLAQVWIEKPLR